MYWKMSPPITLPYRYGRHLATCVIHEKLMQLDSLAVLNTTCFFTLLFLSLMAGVINRNQMGQTWPYTSHSCWLRLCSFQIKTYLIMILDGYCGHLSKISSAIHGQAGVIIENPWFIRCDIIKGNESHVGDIYSYFSI